jgi:hypothetical protein
MSGSISPQAFPVAGGVANGSGVNTPGAGGGIFPHGITATPDQQLSVADQLAAVGIPLGDNAKTNVTPPPMGEQTTTTTSGGGGGIGGALGALGSVVGIGKTVAGLF